VTVKNNGDFPEAGLTVYADYSADLSFAGYWAVSDSQGQADFSLPAGSYRFRVEKNGQKYWSGMSKYWHPDAPPCAVPGCSSDWVQVGMTFKAIAAGSSHTCGLISHDGIKCWGGNGSGQLGDNSTSTRVTPVDVVGLTANVVAISASTSYTCALVDGGGVKCWGYNGFGQLGDGTTTNRLTPVDVSGLTSGVVAISTGAYHACAILSGGAVKCWGSNRTGQLGDGTTTDSLIPVDVVGLIGDVVEIQSGRFFSCARMRDGRVMCWGTGIGLLDHGKTCSPNGICAKPVEIDALKEPVVSLAVGDSHVCVVTDTGNVLCWGDNTYGQLGDGTTRYRETPVEVIGL